MIRDGRISARHIESLTGDGLPPSLTSSQMVYNLHTYRISLELIILQACGKCFKPSHTGRG